MGLFDFLKGGTGDEELQKSEPPAEESAKDEKEVKAQTIEEIAAELAGSAKALTSEEVMAKLAVAIEKMSEVKSPSKEESKPESFIWDDDNHADIVESPKKLRAAIEATIVDSLIPRIESLLKQREEDLMARFEGVAATTAAKNEFFKTHSDLLQHKDYVQFVAEKLSAKHKNMDVDKFGELVAKTVRKSLNLNVDEESPALPARGKSSRTQASEKEDDKSTALMKSIFG